MFSQRSNPKTRFRIHTKQQLSTWYVAEGSSLKHYLRIHPRIHILCKEQGNIQWSLLLKLQLTANSEGRYLSCKILRKASISLKFRCISQIILKAYTLWKVCGFRFIQRTDLTRHFRLHTSLRPILWKFSNKNVRLFYFKNWSEITQCPMTFYYEL
jgi:hypothetical protein